MIKGCYFPIDKVHYTVQDTIPILKTISKL